MQWEVEVGRGAGFDEHAVKCLESGGGSVIVFFY